MFFQGLVIRAEDTSSWGKRGAAALGIFLFDLLVLKHFWCSGSNHL
jgi:hypothetical protein